MQQPPYQGEDPYPQQPYSSQPLPPNTYSQNAPTWQQQPPYTQYPPQPPPPPKKKLGPLFWILIAVCVVAVFGICIAAFNAAPRTPSTASNNPANDIATVGTTPTATTAPVGNYKVGAAAQVGSMSMRLNSVKTSSGGTYDSLKAGYLYLIVDVTVQNNSGSPQNVSSALDFKLNDETGQAYSESFMTGAKAPDDTALRDGAKLRGQLVYEVPKGVKHFTFTYQPNFMASDQATWDINL